jgi:hypothetical protein
MAEPVTVFPTSYVGQLTVGKRLRQLFGKDWTIALAFMAPTLILMAGLILYPFLNAIVLSFFTRSITRQEVFVGFSNYLRLLNDELYLGSLLNTVRFTVYSVVYRLGSEQPHSWAQRPVRDHAVAVDRARGGDGARLARHLRSDFRGPESGPAHARAD